MEIFKKRFPEFAEVGQELILMVLQESIIETNKRVWGKQYQSGVFALAAYKLSISILAKEQVANYLQEYERLLRGVALSARNI